MIITFSVPQAVAKGRPRFGKGRTYTPKATEEAEKAIRTAYEGACLRKLGHVPCAPEHVPVTLTAVFVKRQPKSRPVWLQKHLWDSGVMPFTTKPDYDNLLKLVCDALNGVAYVDDAQVTEVHCIKRNRRCARQDKTVVTLIWEGEETE